MGTSSAPAQRPHALMFAHPMQGHVRPMMQLAECLSGAHGFKVTVANTSYVHKRMARNDMEGEDGMCSVDLQEGIPDEQYVTSAEVDLYISLMNLEPLLTRFIEKTQLQSPPITCIISDLNFPQANYAALRVRIPSVGFSTQSLMSLSVKYNIRRHIDEDLLPLPPMTTSHRFIQNLHIIPLQGDEYKAACSRMVKCIPGMHPIQVGELHSSLLTSDVSHPMFEFFSTKQTESFYTQEWSLVNTFDEFEGPVLQCLQQDAGANLVTCIGPLVISPITPEKTSWSGNEEMRSTSGSLWPEDGDCLGWLDTQKPKSVVYVSFGSTTHMEEDMLKEFVLGLEDAQVPFLLVIRPALVDSSSESRGLPSGFEERTCDRGCVVSWAPQLEVLGHPATAGFVTHSGWNSIIESVSMGVPMLSCPYFADQAMNNRFLVNVWKNGLEFDRHADMFIDRHDVAKKVRMLASEDPDLRSAAYKWKEAARHAVERGGSSHKNMAAFVADMYRRARTTVVSTPQ